MSTKAKVKSKYKKLDHIDHILKRPEMYIGSTKLRDTAEYVVGPDSFAISKQTVNVCPGIIRVFIEPLSNTVDNLARSVQNKVKMTKISVDIDSETGLTSFWNDGDIVPVEMHPEEKCYNHSMIFGQLMTGSNYDDEEERKDISGTFGYGIKCSNIFSSTFTVEGADPVNKKKLVQTWNNNMKEASEPVITPYKTGKGYTKVSFIPDFAQFGLEGYTADIISVYKKLVVDVAMITKIPVFFNGEQIPVSNLIEYARLYSAFDISAEEQPPTLSIKTADCEVVVTPATDSDGQGQTISFVNGIYTSQGGTHVDAWSEAIFRPIVVKLNKPKKPQINIADVRKFFRLFVVASVANARFDHQTKSKLESPAITAIIKKTQLNALFKWPVLEEIQDIIRAKELVVLKKAERKKRGHQKVEGLEPANFEGGPRSNECILILVEGLSAKTYAAWGIRKGVFGKQGRNYMGIYALRGKLLNCRDSKPLSIANNNVVNDIIKSLGLEYNIDYREDKNYNKLRYGRILIITDQDVDGKHISALLQNMFHSLFPSLLEREQPFITSMQTPIVRVYEGKKNKLFYDEQEYHKYVETLKGGKKINKKYYKGLGSSNEEDVEETFGEKMVEFVTDEKTTEAMNKAFNKKFSDIRKSWLETYDPNKTILRWNGIGQETKQISFRDFIDTELIQFSISDCARSIPNIMDGLKEGHRKVLYVCFMRNLKYTGKTIKVAQLAGSVAEKSNYHHGEQNLFGTITNMANCYIGSNNIPLLFRDGQFGTRYEGGKDAANARYINTKLDMLTRLIFRPEDDVLLDYIEDDGDKVEPRFYLPIIPMVLVNGCIGIGTGWSSNIPCYNPLDIVQAVKTWLENDGNVWVESEDPDNQNMRLSLFPELKPWYRDYNGEITYDSDQKYVSWGVVERDEQKGTATVTELPVGLWTSKFVDKLETMRENKEITSYKNFSTPKVVNFVIKEHADGLACTVENLKLYEYIRTSNMVLFTEKGALKKYESVYEIIENFCQVRIEYYIKRKRYILSQIERELLMLGNKKRFLQEVRDGELKLFEMINGKRQSRKTADIVSELKTKGYDMLTDGKEGKVEEGKFEEEDEGEGNLVEDGNAVEDSKVSSSGYNYLLRLQINSITAEKINKLENDIANKEDEKEKLAGTTEKELWLNDLGEFEGKYEEFLGSLNKEKVKTKKKAK